MGQVEISGASLALAISRIRSVSQLATSQADWVIFIAGNAILVLLLIVALVLMWRRTVQLRNDGNNPLLFEETVVLTTDAQATLELIEAAFKGIGASLQQVDSAQRVVLAKTGVSRRSWGQYIEVAVTEDGEGRSSCQCSSWPAFEGTLWDWGAGRLTVEALVNGLRKQDVAIPPSDRTAR
jgi:hypothetical protein